MGLDFMGEAWSYKYLRYFVLAMAVVGILYVSKDVLMEEYYDKSSWSFEDTDQDHDYKELQLDEKEYPWVNRSTNEDSKIIDVKALRHMLSSAAMSNNTVILTMVNHAWAENGSIVDLFLESFRIGDRTAKLLDHLIIICVDHQALTRCQSIHKYCFFLKNPDQIDFASEEKFQSPDYKRLMWLRINLLGLILESGYNFVFTDADIVWFRSPFPRFRHDYDFQSACDYYHESVDKWNQANAGFNFDHSILQVLVLERDNVSRSSRRSRNTTCHNN